ncbi:MAG TPA: DUF5990 family protein [Vicinamibacterales bacterium]|nr:DUF5990 family protein [Vicinamibacterales bacterium]
MTKSSELLLRVAVECTELPGRRFLDAMDPAVPRKEPVYLGIQKGRDVIDQVPADRPHAEFMAEFRVGKKKNGAPNFLGPYAQGSADDRFFYLSWGVRTESGQFAMFRRLKIRLGHLTWNQIRKAANSQVPIAVALRLTDAKGGPLCATPPATHIKWHAPERHHRSTGYPAVN